MKKAQSTTKTLGSVTRKVRGTNIRQEYDLYPSPESARGAAPRG